MNISYFVARKYFFSRKISGVIHIISAISLVGILVGTMALITILSTFNGFEEVVSQLYNTFNSDLKIVPAKGKFFVPDSAKVAQIKSIKGILAYTEIIEDNAAVMYRDQQNVSTLKGMDPAYLQTTGMDSMIIGGDPILQYDSINYALVGAGVASKLDLHSYDDSHPLHLYVPKKGAKLMLNPATSLNQMNILTGGVFSIQQDFDTRYIIVPLGFARELLNEPEKVTALELNIEKDPDIPRIQAKVKEIMGDEFQVLDSREQQPMLYKVMRTEKLVVYLILSFILLIAAFNMIGALLMLALEKKKDMAILISMGAKPSLVRNIILYEGLMLSLGGAIGGLGLGTLLCWLQKQYGFVKIAGGGDNHTFVIDAYPIAFNGYDFLLVFVTVLILGFVASYYPAITANKKIGIEVLRSRR